ncbi:hypothetical protein MMC32_006509 [Xylographa parallela]|nr:hypothetical protein [Xylographa parallela]
MSDLKLAVPQDDAPPSYEVAAKPISAPAKPVPLRAPLPLDLPVLNALGGKRVILASASPRRKQLLAQIGLTNLEVIPSVVPEAFPKSLSPFEYVLQTATQKATTIYAAELNNTKLGEPALIIAADTVVVSLLGQILEKPRSETQHIAMLKSLRDTGAHKVFTAVVVMAPLESAQDPGYALQTSVEETTVRFDKEVTDDMIMAYVKTREGADKAGGYGIQGIGAILVEKIEGSFDNVVGLPLRVTLRLIEKVLDEAIDEEFTAFEDEEEA